MAGEGDLERAVSHTVKAQLALRDLILSGALPQGERLSELSVVERLGVSRTPVRMALVRLEEEGLLEAIPSGGFAVRAFSEADIDDAIEIRGALEGLAARFAAERGASRGRLAELKDCLAEIDDLAGLSEGSEESFSDYVRLNARFHALLHALSDSPALMRQIDRACALPFASPSGFVAAQARLPQSRFILTLAQDQHRCLVEAIENREGERADALAREHARLARRNLRFAFQNQSALDLVAGSALIKRRAR